MKTAGYVLIPLISLLFVLPTGYPRSENESDTALQTTDLVGIVIEHRSFEWRIAEKTIDFIGEVTAREEDLTINCDKMRVYLIDRATDNASQSIGSVDRILATGNVTITQLDGLSGTAKEAVYSPNEDKVMMTGRPQFKQGNNSFEGSKVTFFINEEHILLEGPVRAALDEEGIFIGSESFEMENKEKMFVFSGEVEFRREDMTMTCEKMLGYYDEQFIEKESENLEGMMEEIDRIIATGNVRMTWTDGSLATAEKVVYDLNEEEVVMTGQPVLKQGKNSWEGSELTYHLREGLVSGKKARAVIYTKSEEGVSTGGQ